MIPVFLRKFGVAVVKNSPTILTFLSVGGLFGTVAFAIKATPKAVLLLEDLREENPDASKMDKLKCVAPVYLPTLVMGGVTALCIVGASSISSKRNAVLASLYSASEMALTEYQNKIIETIGPKKEREVRDEIAGDRIRNNPVSQNQVIITGHGNTLCYDSLSGRYFRSDIETIRRIENQVNREIISNFWMSLNEVYHELGLEDINLGYDVGWDQDHMLEFTFSSHVTNDGQPCLDLGLVKAPRPRPEFC